MIRLAMALLLLCLSSLYGVDSKRYRELKRIVDRNTGFAHFTRGMNALTLYALRSCVDERDYPVLRSMLSDRDSVTRMTVANVLVDMGQDGQRIVRERLAEKPDASQRMTLNDALEYLGAPEHRPILEYPLTVEDRRRMRGCQAARPSDGAR